jgi:uncharacterized protein (TIRG00374 family)
MRIAKRAALLAVTAVSLYLVGPALLDVFSSWDEVSALDPFLLQLIVIAVGASFACQWALLRLTLRERRWTNVVTSQLAATAASRVVPGGGAAGSAVQYAMLVRGGLAPRTVASGLTAASLMITGIVFALPALALPAVLGGRRIDEDLAAAAWAGAAAVVLLVGAGFALLRWDTPLRSAGRLLEGVANRLRRGREPSHGLPDRLLRERDLIRQVLSSSWTEALLLTVGRWVFDYGALLLALAAVGAHPAPTAVLLAFCVAQALALIPLTPGGLGFVEAGLTGTLALAGVPSAAAVVATLAYRLASYWLPLPAGAVAYVVHARTFGRPGARPAGLAHGAQAPAGVDRDQAAQHEADPREDRDGLQRQVGQAQDQHAEHDLADRHEHPQRATLDVLERAEERDGARDDEPDAEHEQDRQQRLARTPQDDQAGDHAEHAEHRRQRPDAAVDGVVERVDDGEQAEDEQVDAGEDRQRQQRDVRIGDREHAGEQ